LRRLTRGEELNPYELDEITALGNLRPEDIQAAGSASIEDLGVLEVISASVSTLEERQQDILQRRYGIKTAESETLEEIATGYNVTRERIRQIEKKAKLRIATKRTVKILIAALEREEALERLFKDRKIVSEEQIGIVSKPLKAEVRLAIDLAYGDLRSFLDAVSVRTEAGWVQEQDLLLVRQ
jgi:RNA polymerase primary sigma factor